MAKDGLGVLIADKAPPPDMLGGGEEYGEAPDAEGGKEEAVAHMDSFKAMMDDGDMAGACEALDRYLTARGFVKK